MNEKHLQIPKFLVSGGTSALINVSILTILTSWFGLWYLFSSILAFLLSAIVNFFMQKYWAFLNRSGEKFFSQMGMFLVLTGLNLLLNSVFMYALVDLIGVWYVLAQCLVSGILAFMNFILYRTVIFKKPSVPAPGL